jgi:hypothetical protein
MRRIILLCTVLVSASLAFAQTSKPISPFDQQLIDQQKRFLKAIADKNTVLVNQTVSEDFKGIGSNGDFHDRSEVLDSARDGMPKDWRTYDFVVVRLDDDCAVVTYNEIVPGDHPRYRHMADTWAKIAGQWKLKFRQMTPNLWSVNDLD